METSVLLIKVIPNISLVPFSPQKESSSRRKEFFYYNCLCHLGFMSPLWTEALDQHLLHRRENVGQRASSTANDLTQS